ncbi:MAG TPA: histidine phosphatase family protein [Dehalococcoidia bacterium]|nr:histidine phosphatase family protein [Dehalococcoidia bacterium]
MTDPDRLRALAEAREPRAGFTDLFFLSPGEGVTELFLIRHAQIESGVEMNADEDLTALGREQAHVLAQYLSRYRFDAVYASPSRRAQQTAAPVASCQGLAVKTDEALADIKTLRPLSASVRDTIAEVTGAEGVDVFIDNMRRTMNFDAFAPFVESSADFRARVVGVMNAIVAGHPGGRIAVICHSPVISAYLAVLAGTDRDFILNPRLTSISRVLARDAQRTIDFVNARPHLDNP